MNSVKRGIVFGFILVLGIVLIPTVYAQFRGDHRMYKLNNIDIENVKKFQKTTLPLRDELIIKRLEIRKEYSKQNPDRGKIADLKKEIIDIKTEIEKKADEAGLPAWIVKRKGRGFMADWRIPGTRSYCPRSW